MILYHSSRAPVRGLPRERRPLMAPRRAHRGGAVPNACADVDRMGSQVCARGIDRAGVRSVGT